MVVHTISYDNVTETRMMTENTRSEQYEKVEKSERTLFFPLYHLALVCTA